MTTKNIGALPVQLIRDLINAGHIHGAEMENISPASLDLALSDELYRINEVFLPYPNESIRNLMKEVHTTPHAPHEPLIRGNTYLARLRESLALPHEVYAYCNPKSSTGRNDIHVRVLADGIPRFDFAPAGYKGELWVTITPNSFSTNIPPGEKLSQIRFFTHDTRLSELELQLAIERDKLLWDASGTPIRYQNLHMSDRDGSLILTVDLSGEHVGWESIPGNAVLDLSKKREHDPFTFFRPVFCRNGRILLKQGHFYILRTKEAIRVPPYLASEIVPMDERAGEFRSHYAGFFDPGWGWGKDGEGKGRTAVMEVRPLFQDVALRDGQPIAKFRFEHLTHLPEKHYDEVETSHYTNQSRTAVLSKHFRLPGKITINLT
ncbi:MAG: 2'-deoxycytidine 5'-triphosphate deaminase [Candidatus Ryanbacteria bacterium CG10_big_fil_rev_8_21_14_0_10_43_42]|uniref:2'-deoxycytidine 5'-triphosphate deaminase n=1 Tax=Candidatus Ryanbacteria bacterium CG10_big_fil_rev_8_21_14_0_10_43_42 TaxID=1974864 RepID=A0A2M8KWM5_9BACT|nr:MAG: 2'-deoxycytidine 5'-triphosphate deaminase [Candidatus Ryanbacteria bacterium CG10_big_fil_rev_8_21_14_0_10_43_42]